MAFPYGTYVFYLSKHLKGVCVKYGKLSNMYGPEIFFSNPVPNDDVIHCSPSALACGDKVYCFVIDRNYRAHALELISNYHTVIQDATTYVDLEFKTKGEIIPFVQGNRIYLFYRDDSNLVNWAIYDKNLVWYAGGILSDIKTGDAVSICANDKSVYIFWSNTAYNQANPTLCYRTLDLQPNTVLETGAITNTYKVLSYSPSAVFCNINGYAPFFYVLYQGGSYSRKLKAYHINDGSKNTIRGDGEYAINGINVYTSPSAANYAPAAPYVYLAYVNSKSKKVQTAELNCQITSSSSVYSLSVATAKANASPFIIKI